jgi:hypothetical protein
LLTFEVVLGLGRGRNKTGLQWDKAHGKKNIIAFAQFGEANVLLNNTWMRNLILNRQQATHA